MQIEPYLQRLHFEGPVSATLASLRILHRCHVLSVPFEALDIHYDTPIMLELEHIYRKVILHKRGGYCYELNHLFSNLLLQLGFNCRLIAGQIYNDGQFGPPYDHMAILVELEDLWLVDVGHGKLFLEPIRVVEDEIQYDGRGHFVLQATADSAYILSECVEDSPQYETKYKFDLVARTVSDFSEQNHMKQYSPDSHFVKNRICTIATPAGRKTIYNDRFKILVDGHLTDRTILSEAHMKNLLREHFQIVL